MEPFPDTRLSLIVRLQGEPDAAAWAEFVRLYRPVVIRLARRRGLQDADADDLAQQVLLAVARAVQRWEPDAERGRFRAWLRRIAENCAINALTRRPLDRGSGLTEELERLCEIPVPMGEETIELRREYRREVFQWAAREVRAEFQSETWAAFWLTAVQGATIEEAAETLSKSVGSIYAARSRVMKRLREKVGEWEETEP
jgi:RNA polymerase sigma-70 factor (ECF subfamily)